MPETLIKVDLSKPAPTNEMVHNRWHPDIPMACWVKPGDEFVLETYDWTGGYIQNNDSADDVRDIDLSTVHYLSGPVGVKGAEPGDVLEVQCTDHGVLADIPAWCRINGHRHIDSYERDGVVTINRVLLREGYTIDDLEERVAMLCENVKTYHSETGFLGGMVVLNAANGEVLNRKAR